MAPGHSATLWAVTEAQNFPHLPSLFSSPKLLVCAEEGDELPSSSSCACEANAAFYPDAGASSFRSMEQLLLTQHALMNRCSIIPRFSADGLHDVSCERERKTLTQQANQSASVTTVSDRWCHLAPAQQSLHRILRLSSNLSTCSAGMWSSDVQ